MLRLAIQKSGRLADETLSLLRACGISFSVSPARLRTRANIFPLELLSLRDDDIPGCVADGSADAGIVGENVLFETGLAELRREGLGFGRCRLALAVPRESDMSAVAGLAGLRIATSYPRLLKEYLDGQGVRADIHPLSGSVEIAPSLGVADAICDLVSSGATLVANGLRELETVLISEAVVAARPGLNGEAGAALNQLLFRVRAVLRARRHKYIVLNAPDSALATVRALLPGLKAPTITPLAESGWSAVQSVVAEDAFWEIIGQLEAAGAEGILVMPIEKMIG
ncbi:MAG: ATP phosphoribosyltransferase [Hymenobacteraceae bacterium]|nr:ATP phosphoribosyltransferase [Hymenobacteraceae bacterium]